jgi:molybdenum cofactor cytidylyltransferase
LDKTLSSIASGIKSNALQLDIEFVIVVNPCAACASENLPNWVKLTNENYREGLSSSIKVLLKKSIESGVSGIFLFLADMPFIEPETIAEVLREASAHDEMIIRPVYQKKPGFPLFYPSSLFIEGLGIEGDRGLKNVIAKHPEMCRFILTERPGCTKDVDLPEDLERK